METRVALIGIMVENAESVEKLNDLLHQYRSYIIGRMGVPYREKGLSIISVVLDAAYGQDQQPFWKAWNAGRSQHKNNLFQEELIL